MSKKFKKTASIALLTLSLIGAGGTTASALTYNVAGGTFNFGVNNIGYVFYQQYANYNRSGWHSATAMMNNHYAKTRTYNGNAGAHTSWFTSYSTHNSYYSVG
ncbi:MAG: hypothetical protein LBV19_06770 [Streptococcaceae bacterium]|nr:hypothetical protein [Streptococcaceae bacterium]